MVEKPSKLQPALIGGVIMGVLSVIPFVNFINFCCCAGAIIGGLIAARLLIRRSPVLPISYGEGAATGAIAGVIGSGIYLVIGIPISLVVGDLLLGFVRKLGELVNDPNLQQMIRQVLEQAETQSLTQSFGEKLIGAVIQWFFISIGAVGFATLGGVLGISFFEKRKGQNAGPTPPGYPPPGDPGSSGATSPAHPPPGSPGSY